MKPKLTKEEEKKLLSGICPDCEGTLFSEGPHGGASINVMCANDKCKSKFNYCPGMFAERIDERESKITTEEKEIPRTELIDLD